MTTQTPLEAARDFLWRVVRSDAHTSAMQEHELAALIKSREDAVRRETLDEIARLRARVNQLENALISGPAPVIDIEAPPLSGPQGSKY